MENPVCQNCGTELEFLGYLGHLAHFVCPDCGLYHHLKVTEWDTVCSICFEAIDTPNPDRPYLCDDCAERIDSDD